MSPSSGLTFRKRRNVRTGSRGPAFARDESSDYKGAAAVAARSSVLPVVRFSTDAGRDTPFRAYDARAESERQADRHAGVVERAGRIVGAEGGRRVDFIARCAWRSGLRRFAGREYPCTLAAGIVVPRWTDEERVGLESEIALTDWSSCWPHRSGSRTGSSCGKGLVTQFFRFVQFHADLSEYETKVAFYLCRRRNDQSQSASLVVPLTPLTSSIGMAHPYAIAAVPHSSAARQCRRYILSRLDQHRAPRSWKSG